MPDSPDVDLEALKEKAKEIIAKYDGNVGKEEIHEVAFGLKAIHLIFVIDEEKGTDDIENELSKIENVSSAQVIDYRRAMG